MPLRIRDVIAIPPTKPPLVVKVGEINDEERKAFHAREYVITDTVAEGLRRVVTSVAESADKGFPGQGIWVSGSFGTGKSHFLSFVGMLLRGEPAAWAREIPGLSADTRAILEKRPVFVVPCNSLDRPDDFRLGLYEAVTRELERQNLPLVELTHFDCVIDWFESLAADTPALWQTLFNRSLVVTSQQEYEAQKATPQGREVLAREIATHIAPPAEVTRSSFAVEMAEGIRRITQHLKNHGFAAVTFLIDELTLFLINAKDRTRPMVELKALLEAEGADLPVWALVVRHAPLEDVVRDVGKDILDNIKGRFAGRDVDIQDVDLYEVLGQRVLKPVDSQKQALDQAVQASLAQIPREQLDVLYDLYGQKRFEQAVRALYPFHPAIVDTLVSVTHLLSRERTAISVMYDMLFDLADEPLGTLIPYHRAFHYLIEQASEGELKDQPALQAAKVIMRDKVIPLLEDHFLGRADRIAKGQAVAQSIILGQLTDKGTRLRGRMTPAVIAALNTAILNAKVVILARKQLEETIDLLCDRLLGTFKREGEAVVVELTLGLDPMEELRKVTQDVTEWRRQAVLDLLNNLFGTDRMQGRRKLNIKWRGTSRSGTVQAVEISASNLPLPDSKAEFGVWISFPRFAGDPQPPHPPKNAVPGALWIPKEADDELRQQLDNLARILFLTESAGGKAYIAEKYSGEEGRRLVERWTAAAFQLREALLHRLTSLYSQGTIDASVSISKSVPDGATLQDALKDLGGRLLDARFRQHPEFTNDVTSQALESLYQALIKGDGRVGPEMGPPYAYAANYGLSLRILRSSGTGYALDLGNSPYIQAIEEALKTGEGERVSALQEKLGKEFGLQPFITEFLARLTVIFRDLRVVRGRGPLAIENPAEFRLQSNDLLMPGQRVSHGQWAAFSRFYTAVGAGTVPGKPSVRYQDAAWAALCQFFAQQERTYTQLRRAATEAAKRVGGAPLPLEQALKDARALLDVIDEALSEPTSEAGIQALAQASIPSKRLPDLLEAIREMVARLEDVELRNLYGQLVTAEAQATAQEALSQYISGQKSRSGLLAELKALRQGEAKLEPEMEVGEKRWRVVFKASFGPLRTALEKIGIQPEEGWDSLGELSDDTEVTVEVRRDADS
ncbi:MAG TPA: hypothetical protein G4O02_08100 [Caldilineae bacterium]|nr:hypothetical protein [Caldilineae bacterium]